MLFLALCPGQNNNLNIVLSGHMSNTARQMCFQVRSAAVLTTLCSPVGRLFRSTYRLSVLYSRLPNSSSFPHKVSLPSREKKLFTWNKNKACNIQQFLTSERKRTLVVTSSAGHPTWHNNITKTNSELELWRGKYFYLPYLTC